MFHSIVCQIPEIELSKERNKKGAVFIVWGLGKVLSTSSSDIMSSLIRRLVTQASQIHKWFLSTMNQTCTKVQNCFIVISVSIKCIARLSHRDKVLERDFFNLHKMIIATSLDGVVFGIDSSDGSVVWRLYLGNSFSPLLSSTGKYEVPLFMQRSTTHYQLAGQASVAFKDSNSDGVVVFINPINGELVKRIQLTFSISRVDMLSFMGKDYIHPLIVIGQNEEKKLAFSSTRRITLCNIYNNVKTHLHRTAAGTGAPEIRQKFDKGGCLDDLKQILERRHTHVISITSAFKSSSFLLIPVYARSPISIMSAFIQTQKSRVFYLPILKHDDRSLKL
ncbi:hypothetical protein DICVIV_02613 [Dictyocaulus viviparus]|uniref:ER membrane protein complex subunit 1 n=1 Tax=Dictyocaulus viviparus TaxID=29172 RepID=A0A0D8Y327_DICVI|nr:hypothetical protein DICVIV_02613 [Dictyocaulus viviparus]